MLRKLYQEYEYEEVETPQLFSTDLWMKSGHWENYKDNMYIIKNDDTATFIESNANNGGIIDGEIQSLGLKPMNCPAHCLIYKSEFRSYKSLPIRYAEFGSLHRLSLNNFTLIKQQFLSNPLSILFLYL